MKKFHPILNNVFHQFKLKRSLTIFFFLIMLFFKFALFIRVQKAIDSIRLNSLLITKKYLSDCLILLLGFFGFNVGLQYFFRDLQYTSQYALINKLFTLVLDKDYSYHEKYTPAVTLSMIKDDSKFISDWKSIGSVTLFGNIITMIVAMLIITYYSIFLSLSILIVILLCFLFTHYISKKIGVKTYDLQVSYSHLSQSIIDYLGGIKEIKQYRKEKYFQKSVSNFINKDTYQHSKTISRYYSLYTSIYAVLTTALPVLAVLFGLVLILLKKQTIGELIAVYALVGNLQEPVMVIPEFLNQRRQALAIQEKLLPILQTTSGEPLKAKAGKLKILDFDSKVYAYNDKKKILQNVNFKLGKGDCIILHGESGKGKTSLINLISRFYSIKEQEVTIKYNGESIIEIDPDSYYLHVLQLPQNPYVFQGSLLENLVLGDDFSKDELKAVLHAACLDDFADHVSLEYMIEQNGENISGGQKQRIGLARILLRKPDVLMLDEPLSALNPELADLVAERVICYCRTYQISLIIISHNDSFERCFKKRKDKNVNIIQL